jgi:hypothetical protein
MSDESSTDTFTETSTQGWGARIGQSFVGMLFGFLLMPAAIVLPARSSQRRSPRLLWRGGCIR